MATSFLLAKATVTGANTATRVTAGQGTPTTRIPANSVCIQAGTANVADVYVGDSTVQSSSTLGIVIPPRGQVVIDSGAGANALNLADIYFASTSAAATVNVFYVQV